MANPFQQAWGAVVDAASRAGAAAGSVLRDGARAVAELIHTGEVTADQWQKKAIDVLTGRQPPGAILDVVRATKGPLDNFLINFGILFPAIDHNGKRYSWSEARKTPEGMLWFLAASCLAAPSRFAKALGSQVAALDGYRFGADDPNADGGDESSGESAGYPEPDNGSGYQVAPPEPGKNQQGRAPPLIPPELLATVTATIGTVVAFAKEIIAFVKPPAGLPIPTFQKKEAPKPAEPESDYTWIWVALAIYFFVYRKSETKAAA